ncbi:MAG: hypothetical protein BWX48_01975 [Verrucomicrobia bacterium ADurb.Bin006]|jgi:hypothetical protein|nr:MAG: hypothetical protein BWX48_01975 [Verrucomicrobia bacterium ADurb.Bin006]
MESLNQGNHFRGLVGFLCQVFLRQPLGLSMSPHDCPEKPGKFP